MFSPNCDHIYQLSLMPPTLFPSMRSRLRITSSFPHPLLYLTYFSYLRPCLNGAPLPHFQAETGSEKTSCFQPSPLNPRTEIFPGIPPRAPKRRCLQGRARMENETRAGRETTVGLGWIGSGLSWYILLGGRCMDQGQAGNGSPGENGAQGVKR